MLHPKKAHQNKIKNKKISKFQDKKSVVGQQEVVRVMGSHPSSAWKSMTGSRYSRSLTLEVRGDILECKNPEKIMKTILDPY